jgi:hypothetical protein
MNETLTAVVLNNANCTVLPVQEVGPPKNALNETREPKRGYRRRVSKKEPEIELGAGLRPGESHEVEFTKVSRLGKVE